MKERGPEGEKGASTLPPRAVCHDEELAPDSPDDQALQTGMSCPSDLYVGSVGGHFSVIGVAKRYPWLAAYSEGGAP